MPTLPHDYADLLLAPTILAVDARLSELALLDVTELAERIAIEGDHHDLTAQMRSAGLLRTVEAYIDMHGWTLTWDPRGIRLQHGAQHVVLGVPPTFRAYVEAAPVIVAGRR